MNTSRIEVFGNGNLDISFHNASGVTIGSITSAKTNLGQSRRILKAKYY